MEYVEGELLSSRVAKGPLAIREVVEIGLQVTDALDEAHSARDRAPRRQEREPDADRARAGQGARLRAGQVRQARGRRGGAAHAAAGHDRRHGRRAPCPTWRPSRRSGGRSITARISSRSASCSSSSRPAASPSSARRPPRSSITSCTRFRRRRRTLAASVPPSFDAVVARALEKSPTFRYQSARDMQQDLRHVAGELDTVPRGTTSRVAAGCRRRRPRSSVRWR